MLVPPNKSLLALNLCHVLLDGFYDSIPVLLAIIVAAQSNADTIVGMVTSLAALASTLAGLATISFSARFTLMQATLIILLMGGIGFGVVAVSDGIWLAGLGFIIVALGQSVFHNMAFSFFTHTTDRASLGRAISDFTAIGDLGRIPLISLSSAIGAMSFYGIAGWRVATGSFALVNVLLFIACYPVLFAKKSETTPRTDRTALLPNFTILRDKRVLFAVLANMLNTISCGSLFTFLPLLLLSKGFEAQTLAGFAFGFSLGCFVGKIACGRLIDRFGSRKVFVVAQILLSLFIGFLLVSENFYFIVTASLLIGLVTKGSVPIAQTLATEHVQREQYDDVFSVNSLFRGGAMIGVPLLFGFLASILGIEAIYMVMAAVSIVAIVPIIALWNMG